MKRICTESEHELLNKNKNQILEGKFKVTVQKYTLYCTLLILSTLALIAAIAWSLNTFSSSSLGNIIFLLLVCYSNFIVIMTKLCVKNKPSSFIQQPNLMINGATIVEVNTFDRFTYIEDDMKDDKGRPILIEYLSSASEVTSQDVGKRILVIYDNDSNLQLMMLNDDLKGLVPEHSPDYPLKSESDSYLRIPHPNMMKVDKEEKVLFHSFVVRDNKIIISVYEWKDNQVQLCEYPAVRIAANTVYGNVLYKSEEKNGKYVFQCAIPYSQKEKKTHA